MAELFNGKEIKTGRVKRLVRNYKNQKWRLMNTTVPEVPGMPEDKGDTRSLWFSKEFITEVLAPAIDKPEVGGVRIHLGAYEHTHKNKDKRGKTTLIFIPTANYGPGKPGRNMLKDPNEPEIDDREDDVALYDEKQNESGNPQAFDEFNDGSICPPVGCDDDERSSVWPKD